MSVRVPAVPRRLATSAVAVGLAWVALSGSAAAEPIQTGPTSIATSTAPEPSRWTAPNMQLESDGLRATARWLWKPQTPTTPPPQRSPRP